VRDLGNTPGHLHHWSKRKVVDLVQRHAAVKSVHSPFPWTLLVAERRSP
jgi:hypothetical protein